MASDPKPWASTYLFNVRRAFGRLTVGASMRRTDGWMGRFGGGWNWKLGVALGSSTLLIDLLVLTVTFSLEAPRG